MHSGYFFNEKFPNGKKTWIYRLQGGGGYLAGSRQVPTALRAIPMVVMDRWDICRLKFMIISSAQFLNFTQWAKNGESGAGLSGFLYFRYSRFSATERILTA